MNIGIFSGSFNPVHIGHLILANYIVEFTEIEEVWFVVSPESPFKSGKEQAGEGIRLKMVEIALKNFPKLKPCDVEFTLPKPSYTIDTIKVLQEKYPDDNFSLIIGADNWNSFENWKEHDKILEKCDIKVYPRLGSRISIPNKLKGKVEALESPIIEISSTFIRDGIKNNKNMRAFLLGNVFEYIVENKLYE
jgi:nicotinate (nicotinamide) nucleotide adenylyltransferase